MLDGFRVFGVYGRKDLLSTEKIKQIQGFGVAVAPQQ
jgi:hypothetical protein